MKSFITVTLLSAALLVAPAAQSASYQDRAMGTGAVVGATTGAVIGSSHNQVVQGAIFGAVLGTIAGAIIANQQQSVHIVQRQPRTHYKPVRHHYQPQAHYKPVRHYNQRPNYEQSYSRSNNRQHNQYAARRDYDHERRERH